MIKSHYDSDMQLDGKSSLQEQIDALEGQVADQPRRAAARVRLGQALFECGRCEEAAAQLQLAARLEPLTPDVALIACRALVDAKRERDAALLLSSHVHRQRAFVRVGEEEVELLRELLLHQSAFVRCHTAKAIGRLGLVQVCDALELRVEDPDASVRFSALTSLKRLATH